MDKIKNITSGGMSEWKNREEKLEGSWVVRNTVLKGTGKKFMYLTMTIQVCLRQKTLKLFYENQRVDAVQDNNRCLFWLSY